MDIMERLVLSCLLFLQLQLLALSMEAGPSKELKNGVRRSLFISVGKTKQMVDERLRSSRSVLAEGGLPTVHGNYSFNDNNPFASIHYSGSTSPVILVLTFRSNSGQQPINAKLYRSSDYGATFTLILDRLDSTDDNPPLWKDFFVSPIDNNLVIIHHANEPRLYYSINEGATWTTQTLTPSTINPRSLLWNPVNDRTALAHDSNGNQLYVTQDLGATWTKIADYVAQPSDYQWGDPSFDVDPTVVYFNTYDPAEVNQLDLAVSLSTQRSPYNSQTLREFDPNLGLHDEFLLLGPYIFAQKSDSRGTISLHVSYKRQAFVKAMIPATDPHQNYIVSHIDQQQAMVIVEHGSGQHNLYLSDITGVYYSLSLPDVVVDGSNIDLELIEGVNGTLVANQHVRSDSNDRMRSLISLDNGGNWELVRSPSSEGCIAPDCSLHFHMTSSAYARTGVYSQASAPGLILAHGNTGSTLNANDPDLFISRDGGVSWSLTLHGSWGVTVADHGGLLVAAKDYHQIPSTQLRYSCNEGISWSDFVFSSSRMTVFGVVTEPGEHTTTVSLYGLKEGTSTWDVVTVNFSAIFPSTCSGSDYYYWHPWDDRTDEDCILGSTVTIERRNASVCCLVGEDYSRPIQFSVCPCFEDDFECDYGYMHSDGFSGPCVLDDSIVLEDPCADEDTVIYQKSLGYRKVAGDICVGGEETLFSPTTAVCSTSNKTRGNSVVTVLAVFLVLAVVAAVIFALLFLFFFCKRNRQHSGVRSTPLQFHDDSASSQPFVTSGTEDEDDDPLAL